MLVSGTTEKVREYLISNKISLLSLSQKTGITYSQLYNSLGNQKRERDLRLDEFMSICKALNISPETFE